MKPNTVKNVAHFMQMEDIHYTKATPLFDTFCGKSVDEPNTRKPQMKNV